MDEMSRISAFLAMSVNFPYHLGMTPELDPKLDALFDAYRKATTDEEHKKLFGDIQVIVADDMPMVPVFNGPTWYQFSTKRFTGWVTDKEPVMNPENHDNNRMRLVHLLRLKPVQ